MLSRPSKAPLIRSTITVPLVLTALFAVLLATPPHVASAEPTPVSTSSPATLLSTGQNPEPIRAGVRSDAQKAAMARAVGPGASMGRANPESGLKRATGGPPRSSGIGAAAPLSGSWKPAWGVPGIDVSAWQAYRQPDGSYLDAVDWTEQWNLGARFAYVKASEGSYSTNGAFAQQYRGSQRAGMIRGAYHFAIPHWSSGADQARYFVQSGGGWSHDGITMPPVLDIEFNPYEGQTIDGNYLGNACYSMSPAQLVAWISDFSKTMLSLTGRRPVIYTATTWWATCTGNSAAFTSHPLWMAAYNESGPGSLPSGWAKYSIWQYSSSGPFEGDSNVWNGDAAALKRFATYGEANPSAAIGASYARSGNEGGVLRSPSGGVRCGLTDGGCYQLFQRGAINWSSATGSHPTLGAIRKAWGRLRYERGVLGYPTTDEVCGLTPGGCYQLFQRGAINWSSRVGAYSTHGAIRTAWAKTGYERGYLGYPNSFEYCPSASSCTQTFDHGSISWDRARGVAITRR